jgi:hypothetical protein
VLIGKIENPEQCGGLRLTIVDLACRHRSSPLGRRDYT